MGTLTDALNSSINFVEKIIDHFSPANEIVFSNFEDSTFNVLILPFNKYEEQKDVKIQFERILEARLNELIINKKLPDKVRSNLKIYFLDSNQEYVSTDSVKNIGNYLGADLVIFGDFYHSGEIRPTETLINFLFLSDLPEGFKEIESVGLIEIDKISLIKEGKLLNDLDYIVFTLLCFDQLYKNNLSNAVEIAKIIISDFNKKEYSVQISTLMNLIASEYLKIEQLNIAVEFYIEARELDTTSAWANNNLGVIYYYNFNNVEMAKIYLLSSIYNNPDYAYAYNNLANIMSDMGEPDYSRFLLLKAISIESRYEDAYYNLAKLYSETLNKPDSAKILYQKALQIKPNDISSLFNLASLNIKHFKNYQTADSLLKRTIEIDSLNWKSYLYLGDLYSSHFQDFISAEKYYLEAIELNPYFTITHYNYATLAKDHLAKPRMAEKHYNFAIALDSNYVQSYVNLALLYVNQLNYPKKAEKLFLDVLNIEPNFAEAHLNYAVFLLESKKDKNQALKHYKIAIGLNPKFRTSKKDNLFGIHK